jgi:hypothetical protein
MDIDTEFYNFSLEHILDKIQIGSPLKMKDQTPKHELWRFEDFKMLIDIKI